MARAMEQKGREIRFDMVNPVMSTESRAPAANGLIPGVEKSESDFLNYVHWNFICGGISVCRAVCQTQSGLVPPVLHVHVVARQEKHTKVS